LHLPNLADIAAEKLASRSGGRFRFARPVQVS
jgi:hypothetical protein